MLETIFWLLMILFWSYILYQIISVLWLANQVIEGTLRTERLYRMCIKKDMLKRFNENKK